MLRRAAQLLAIAALVNLVYQYWPRGEADELYPVMNADEKWGYVDGDGRVRIPFVWEEASAFNDNAYTKVRGIKGSGLINRKGEVIIEPLWESMSGIDEFGLLTARGAREWVRLNLQGEVILRVGYNFSSFIYPLQDCGLGIFSDSGFLGLVNVNGDLVSRAAWQDINRFNSEGVAAALNHSGWKLINLRGETVVECEGDFTSVGEFGANGLSKVMTGRASSDLLSDDFRYGWMDMKGKVVIPVEWEDAWDFDAQGMAAVGKDGKWGWINEAGEVVLKREWDEAYPFGDRNYAPVRKGDRWSVIDRTGKIVLGQVDYTFYSAFNRFGLALVFDEFDNRGFVDERGNTVIEPKWEVTGKFDDHGHVLVEADGKSGLFDKEGNMLYLRDGDVLQYDDNDRSLLVRHQDSEAEGWVDRNGELVIEIAFTDGWRLPNSFLGEAYTVTRLGEISGLRMWYAKVVGWLKGENYQRWQYECRTYNKHGDLIWSSTWLRKTTKAWLYLFAALLPLLIVMWLGWRKRRQQRQSIE